MKTSSIVLAIFTLSLVAGCPGEMTSTGTDAPAGSDGGGDGGAMDAPGLDAPGTPMDAPSGDDAPASLDDAPSPDDAGADDDSGTDDHS